MISNNFASRHNGVSNPAEEQKMLDVIGVKTMDELIEKAVPAAIRLKEAMPLPEGMSEYQFLNHVRSLAQKNKLYKSYIGMGYYGTITDSNACKHSGIGSNPDVLADVDGCIAHALAFGRVKVVIDGCQYDIMPDECTLVNGDAALILELTTHIDEHPLTNNGIFAAIGMERRKHTYRLGDLASPKSLQQIVQFFRCVVLAVNLSRYLQSLL